MSRKKLITISIVLTILGILSVLAIRLFNKSAEEIAYYSGVSWLRTSILAELDGAYAKIGEYPERLEDLEIDFPGDNATPEMLKHFTYTTDGKSFKLRVDMNDHIYEYYGQEGESVVKEKIINK